MSNSAASLPKKSLAPLNSPAVTQFAPDGSSGYGGKGRRLVQAASGAVFGLPSVSASWMAVVGRQKLQWAFSAQQLMSASAADMLVMAKYRASWLIVSPFATETCRSAALNIGIGWAPDHCASEVWASVRVEPVARPSAFTSLNSVVYWALVRADTPAVWKNSGRGRVKGLTLRTHPFGSLAVGAALAGRHCPGPGMAGTGKPGAPNRPSAARAASIAAAASAPTLIPWALAWPSAISASEWA